MKKLVTLMISLSLVAVTAGCGTKAGEAQNGSAAVKTKDTLTIAWYPNESGAEMKGTRDEIGKVVAAATGKKVEHKTTTDYTIAIEAIASGSADIVYTGAQGYVEANKRTLRFNRWLFRAGNQGRWRTQFTIAG